MSGGSVGPRERLLAKFGQPGVVLSSSFFVKECANPAYRWALVGEPDLKGIGKVKVYQLGKRSVEIVPTTEIAVTKLESLRSDLETANGKLEEMQIELQQVRAMNVSLQEKVRELGEVPAEEDTVDENDEKTPAEHAWDEIQAKIRVLSRLIDQAGVPAAHYARFLFLSRRKDGDEYNRYDRPFDECIQKGFVEERGGLYYLNMDHRRSQKAVEVMKELEGLLETYQLNHREDDDSELYDYSLRDADFWKEHVGYDVV